MLKRIRVYTYLRNRNGRFKGFRGVCAADDRTIVRAVIDTV